VSALYRKLFRKGGRLWADSLGAYTKCNVPRGHRIPYFTYYKLKKIKKLK
jgi:hypothetical protein